LKPDDFVDESGAPAAGKQKEKERKDRQLSGHEPRRRRDSENVENIHLCVSESLRPVTQFVDFVPGKNCVMKINESRNCLLVTYSP
jgi:hypothetical protein